MSEATIPEISIDLQYLKQYYNIKYYCFGIIDKYGDLYFQRNKTNSTYQFRMIIADYEFEAIFEYTGPTIITVIKSCFEREHWHIIDTLYD